MRRNKQTDLRINILLFVLAFLFSFTVVAQDKCEQDLSSKTNKLLEKGGSKKYSRQERIDFLQDALEIDEDCLECMYLLGYEYFIKAKAGHASYAITEENYKEIIRLCPDFHSDPYYYLGVINYGRNNYQDALNYFSEYVRFPTDDESKFSKDSDKKYDDVKEVIKELEFKASFYGNPVPFQPIKVQQISTQNDEYLPMLSPDNEIIFFTRKSMKKAKGDLFAREIEELVLAQRPSMDSDFSVGEAMEAPFNLGDNYGGVSISIDNKEMFITICNKRMDGYNNCDIYSSKYEKHFDESDFSWNWAWGQPVNLGEGINTPDGWEAQPSISGDGLTLYFATAREASLDHSIDIYKSDRLEDGSWTDAYPIEGDINTSGNEKSPFIHSDSKTLYFACDNREGAGGYDIFYVRSLDDSLWSKPANIGYPINSDKDEHGLIVSTDGKKAYYASNQLKGHGGYDVFSFEMPVEAKPDQVILVKGKVDMDEGDYLEDIKVILKNMQTKKVTEVDLDMEDGKFTIIMNVEENDFILEVEKEGAPFEAHVFTQNDTIEVISHVDYTPKLVEVGEEYIINDIHYQTNSADFDKASEYMLLAFADYLVKYQNLSVIIMGHTDDVGDDLANYALSADRAFTVKLFLESNGVVASRIDFKGIGEAKPIATNESDIGRALNRRTTFKVVEK